MSDKAPRVSIGMPVRNGQKYIAQAIDSILAQTFTDWELIVCDNASTDATEQIVRDYAARDPRVRYHRNPRDIGPAANQNLSFDLSRGEFFRWNAHDDMIAPDYLAVSVPALEADPSVVCVHPKTLIVDHNGDPMEEYDFKLATDSPNPLRRFAELVLVKHRMHRAVEIFGLMRSSILRRIGKEGAYARADSVMLVRVALCGRYQELPQRLFFSRSHPSQSMQQLPSRLRDARGRARWSRFLGTGPLPPPEWWDSSLKNKITFPEWRLFREYWRTIGESGIGPLDKFKCYAVMGWWSVKNLHKLLRDVVIALEQLVGAVASRVRQSGVNTPKSA